jgi:hypothetical protein
VRTGQSHEVADLIDAAALLWRVELRGGDVGARWNELACAWAPHITDAFCTFNDLHAVISFVGARKWHLASRLERELAWRQTQNSRYGATTRHVGLPLCRAIMAFGRGEYASAVNLMTALPAVAHRLGGSHAQRDVLHLTLQRASEYAGRRAFRTAAASPSMLRPALELKQPAAGSECLAA